MEAIMYMGEGIMQRDIWASAGIFSKAGFLCRKGQRVRVFDSPFLGYPRTIEPTDGSRAFCCAADEVVIIPGTEQGPPPEYKPAHRECLHQFHYCGDNLEERECVLCGAGEQTEASTAPAEQSGV